MSLPDITKAVGTIRPSKCASIKPGCFRNSVNEEMALLQRLLIGGQATGKALSSEIANWLASTIADAREKIEARFTPYKPFSAWSQCLAGLPVRQRDMKSGQFNAANETYENDRPRIAQIWQQLNSLSSATERDQLLKTCSCDSWVKKVNSKLSAGLLFLEDKVCLQ